MNQFFVIIFFITSFLGILLLPCNLNTASGNSGFFPRPDSVLVSFSRNPSIDIKDSVVAVVPTFLGNESRNFIFKDAPDKLSVEWKLFLGSGETFISAKDGKKNWFGAGWTGQPLIIEENGHPYIVQGCFDHHLKKIDAVTGNMIWQYAFDDVVKGTGTFWVNTESRNPENRYVIFQGSRRGIDNTIYSPHTFSFRAISYFSGKELWRYDVKQTQSYSRDVDGSPLVINDTLYAVLENGTLAVVNPLKTDSGNAFSQPELIREIKLYDATDFVNHSGNLVAESSPCRLGKRIYISAGSGHVFGYNLQNDSIEWDYYIGADLDGSPVVTDDSCILVTIEKQYIKGQGGVLKLNPALTGTDAVVWFFPTGNKAFATWQGGVVGSVAIYEDSIRSLAAFAGIDGILNIVNHKSIIDKKCLGFDGKTLFNQPAKLFSYYIGPTISTPVFAGNKLVVAGYLGIYIFSFDNNGNFSLSDYMPGIFEATPSVYNKKIYIASRDGFLYCFGNDTIKQNVIAQNAINKTVKHKLVVENKAFEMANIDYENNKIDTTMNYLLVAGSFKTRQQVAYFENILKNKGIESIAAGPQNGYFYNIINSFKSINEAYVEVLRLNNMGYSQVWVLKNKQKSS